MRQQPDFARAVALARRAREPRRGAQTLVFAAILAAGLHGASVIASLGAAVDVPSARTREVDVMKLSKIAAIGAVSVASSAWAGGKVPPGWMEVADSQAQFSGVQGESGWHYLFDRGPGSEVLPMPFLIGSGPSAVRCTASLPGTSGANGSYCTLYQSGGHANSPFECNNTIAGLQRPIRRWGSPTPTRAIVVWDCDVSLTSTGMHIALMVDESTAFEFTSALGSNAVQSYIGEFESVQAVWSLADPMGSCHGDGYHERLRVFIPDCNANQISDAIEIANGTVYDRNHDGVPDPCQCLADVIENGVVDGADLAAVLTVWGTNGGIYPRADTNADGFVDGADLATVLGGWGLCP